MHHIQEGAQRATNEEYEGPLSSKKIFYRFTDVFTNVNTDLVTFILINNVNKNTHTDIHIHMKTLLQHLHD